MPQIINTNIASLNAQRNLNSAQRANDTALQRLSSGLRINSAKDDAAGLAISTRFDSQIRGTNQAIRNSGDAISLAQTAEGALNSMTASLQRVRELALQSANDTNTGLDRQALQEEVDQLVAEIENVAESTNFNGKKLLDGSFQKATFQTGANAGDNISISIAKLSTDTLGTAKTAGISSIAGSTTASGSFVGTATNGQALVSGDLVINGIAVGGSVGTSDTASTYQAASSSIAKAAAINSVSDQTGVTATVNANVVAGTSTGGTVANVTNATVSINNVKIELSNSTSLTAEQNLQAVADAINAKTGQTGVTAVFSGDATQGVKLVAEDGRNIAIGGTAAGITAKFGMVSNTAVTSTGNPSISNSTQDVFVGSLTLSSKDGSDIALTTDTGDIDNGGFEVGTYSGVNSGVVSDGSKSGSTANAALATGDLVINGVAVGPSVAGDDTASTASASGSAIAKAAAINTVSSQTGVTAVVNENRVNSIDDISSATGGSAVINGVTITTSFATGDTVDVKLQNIIDAVNAKSGQTGVTAEALDADSFTLVAADGRNINLASGGTAFGAVAATNDNTTFVSSITLQGAGTIELSSNTNNIAQAGFKVGTYGGSEGGTLLKDIDITTAAGATKAVEAIDNALQTISSRVAELGAVQNRFENTISNLQVNSENLSAANSRIKDADFAAETAALSRSQVLQQAGISILAQANGRPQQVLSLLQ